MKFCKFDGIMIFIHGAIDFLLPKKHGLLIFWFLGQFIGSINISRQL